MKKLRQSFVNKTGKAQFINLELATSRFRLDPGEELLLFYDPVETQDEGGSTLRIKFRTDNDVLELAIWTGEFDMFLQDGTPATPYFGR